jgi:hypothetical protein
MHAVFLEKTLIGCTHREKIRKLNNLKVLGSEESKDVCR